ncbi:MAG: hypothetical protein L6Q73_17535 [Aquabacterium sp.]|nr:hypothetical protein [Aquabacterium sp.]
MPNHTYYFSPAAQRVVDIAMPDGTGAHSRKTREQLLALHPDLRTGPAELALRTIEDTYLEAPRPVTEDDFEQAYGALPPLHSRHTARAHSFMLSEMHYGRVTRIYAHLRESGTYWTLRDRIDATHEDIERRCELALAGQTDATPTHRCDNG